MDPRAPDPTRPMTWAERSDFRAATRAHDAARAVAALSFDVLLAAWRRRPECLTLANLQAVGVTDPTLAEAFAIHRRDLRRIAGIETQLIERGWLADAERSVRVTDDGGIIVTFATRSSPAATSMRSPTHSPDHMPR